MARRQKAEIAATAICISIIAATCSMGQLPFGLDPLGTLGWTPKRLNPNHWWRGNGTELDEMGVRNGVWTSTAMYTNSITGGKAFLHEGASRVRTGIVSNAVPFSVALWALPTAAPSSGGDRFPMPIGQDRAGIVGRNWALYKSGTDPDRWSLRTANLSTVSTAPDYPLGSWYHLAVTITATNYTLYVNGVQRAQASNASDYYVYDLVIGGRDDTSSPFVGAVSEVLYFSRELQPAEILLLADPANYTRGK